VVVDRLFRDPMARLHEVLERGEAELDRRRAELMEVRHALLQLEAEATAPGRAGPSPVWERLTAEVAPPVARQLSERTTGLVRSSILTIDVGPGTVEENILHAQRLLAEGRLRQRTIYPVDVMVSEEGRAWVRSWGSVGEEQRVSLHPPSDFAIFGDEAVLAVSEWGNAAADYVLIREPMIVAAFTSLFDRAFERALPVAEDLDAAGSDQRLLRLLGLGLKDESIARYLGVSLRTVRRRVAHLMDIHGAETRFQLGLAIARDGLVESTGLRGR
jgi:hypothetical protein